MERAEEPDLNDEGLGDMFFETALMSLKHGVNVRRASWIDDEYVSIKRTGDMRSDPLAIMRCNSVGVIDNEWLPKMADLLAGDWEIAK